MSSHTYLWSDRSGAVLPAQVVEDVRDLLLVIQVLLVLEPAVPRARLDVCRPLDLEGDLPTPCFLLRL